MQWKLETTSTNAAMATIVEAQSSGDAMFYVITVWLFMISMMTIFSSTDVPKRSLLQARSAGRGSGGVGRSDPAGSYLS